MTHNKSTFFNKFARGFTLMEMLIVLAIAAVFLVGSLSRGGATTSKTNANQANTDLAQIYLAVHDMKNGTGNYGPQGTNLVPSLNTQNQIPGDLTVTGSGNSTTITTPLGGTISVTSNVTTFTVVWTNAPADVCSSMLENAQGSQWASAQIGSGAAITPLPAAIATATSTSNCGSGQGPYSMTFTSLN